jgi:hypothetical protein
MLLEQLFRPRVSLVAHHARLFLSVIWAKLDGFFEQANETGLSTRNKLETQWYLKS